MLATKRVYEAPDPRDGFRVLVDRLWPRGISKERAQVDEWLREAGPTDQLRKWFHQNPERWEEFRERYLKELADRKHLFDKIVSKSHRGRVTMLYSYHDPVHNQAVVIKEFLEDGSSGKDST